MLLMLDAERERLQIVIDNGLSGERADALGDARRCRSRCRRPTRRAPREPVFLSDEADAARALPRPGGQAYPRAGAYAALPLIASGRTLGVLSFGFTRAAGVRRRTSARC